MTGYKWFSLFVAVVNAIAAVIDWLWEWRDE